MNSRRTPFIEQYLEQKRRYPDALLFFRMGDFYELFFEDAVTASRELEIALTTRDKKKEDAIPMCGVPHHSVEGYIQRALDRGFKIAICEQIEDPAKATGIVQRAVTRVITPGVTLSPDMLDAKSSVYIAAISMHGGRFGVAFAEFTTGEFAAFELDDEQSLIDELGRICPAEALIPDDMNDIFSESISGSITVRPASEFEMAGSLSALMEHFEVGSLDGIGLAGHDAAVRAVGALINYLKFAQGDSQKINNDEAWMAGSARYIGGGLDHLREFKFLTPSDTMILDASACANLELVETLRDRKKAGSLIEVLDRTVTSAGARLLRRWLLYPLIDVQAIELRHEAVASFVDDNILGAKIRALLENVFDLQRLASKISGGNFSPRDALALAATHEQIPFIVETMAPVGAAELIRIKDSLDPLSDPVALIRRAIREDSPATLKDGGVFKQGYDAERDEFEMLTRDSRKVIEGIETRERTRTGINNLRVGFNKVFGYYIEVTNSNLASVPADFIRKQTLVNAERYITPELKELEEKILHAEERIVEIEFRLFKELRNATAKHLSEIQANAAALSELDVYQSLADAASRYRYIRPVIDNSGVIEIEGGRHPVVERMNLGERFVPNDISLDNSENQVLIITGPNMAGKSTVMRQAALIAIMAQMGSFVPADRVVIGIVDRIFTRVGAGDILHRGQSTFMVEMSETAHILRHATSKSLVLLDEIGRGTSTFDGLSLAWAVAEYLHDRVGAKTLFATHYHELTDLALTKNHVRNVHISVKEWGGKIIFLRKIVKGGVNRSYGIQVARLAGIPLEVVDRAKEILANLERGEIEGGAPRIAKPARSANPQLTLFDAIPDVDKATEEVLEIIRGVDPEKITPIEAIMMISELHEKLKK